MRPTRIRWLSTERRRQLLEALQRHVRQWSEEWSVAPDGFAIELLDSDHVWDITSWRWGAAVCPTGTLFFGAPWEALGSLGGLLAQAAAENDLGLGRRVAERSIQSLIGRLMGDASACLWPGDPPSPKEREKRFGGLGVRLRGLGFNAALWLDGQVCEFLCPVPDQERAPLDRVESALGSEAVTLDVVLDFGPATVGDTRGLRVGEVLVSRTPLEGLFKLTASDGSQVARASLFRSGASRAVRIESA